MAVLPQFKTFNPDTSNFNLSHRLKTTVAPGIIYPVLTEYLVPGQKIKLGITSQLKSMQTLAPVLGSMVVQYEIYFSAASNYVPDMGNNEVGFLDNNYPLPFVRLGSGNIDRLSSYLLQNVNYNTWYKETEVSTGQFRYTKTLPAAQQSEYVYNVAGVSPSSLWSFLDYGAGYPFWGNFGDITNGNTTLPNLNGLGFLTYWDIVRNYYANTQEDYIPCYEIGSDFRDVDKAGGFSVTPISAAPNSRVRLENLDSFFKNFYAKTLSSTSRAEGVRYDPNDVIGYWFNYCYQPENSVSKAYSFMAATSLFGHFSGLAVHTLQPDYFTARLNASRVDQATASVKVNTSGNSFTVDALRYANKYSRLVNLSLFSGGRFDDWQRAQWSVKPNNKLRIPEFIGSFTQNIGFDEIVSTSGTATGDYTEGEGLGAVAGRMNDIDGSQDHYFTASTYGTLMVMCTLIPRVAYSNNIPKPSTYTNLNDWYIPTMDRVGFQDIFWYELSALPYLSRQAAPSSPDYGRAVSTDMVPIVSAIGKQPAWSELMSRVDKCKGNFSASNGTLDFWTIPNNPMNYYLNDNNVPDTISLTPSQYTRLDFQSILQAALDAPTRGITTAFDFDSYINPDLVNILFPSQGYNSENFYLQIAFDLYSNTPKSKELLPTL